MTLQEAKDLINQTLAEVYDIYVSPSLHDDVEEIFKDFHKTLGRVDRENYQLQKELSLAIESTNILKDTIKEKDKVIETLKQRVLLYQTRLENKEKTIEALRGI